MRVEMIVLSSSDRLRDSGFIIVERNNKSFKV